MHKRYDGIASLVKISTNVLMSLVTELIQSTWGKSQYTD